MTIDNTTAITNRTMIVVSTGCGVTFGALTVVQAISPLQSDPFSRPSDYAIETLFLAGLLAVTAAAVVVHRWHAGTRWARLGAVASGLSAVGSALLAVVVGATLLSGGDALGELFLLGFAAWTIGSILLAVAAFRARQLPRPVAVLLGAAIPLSTALGEPFGPLAVAALWAAVAISAGRRG